MSKADIAHNTLPTVDLDTSAFTGTGGQATYDEIDLATADRGDNLDNGSETPEAATNTTDNGGEATEPQAAKADNAAKAANDNESPENGEDATEPADTGDNNAEAAATPEKEAVKADNGNEKTAPQNVPYARFRKELERRKALENEIEELRKNAPQATFDDLKIENTVSVDNDKFKAMSTAFAEGDTATAQAIFTEILTSNVTNAMQAAAKTAAQQAYETARQEVDAAVQSRGVLAEAQEAAQLVVGEYDCFNDKSDAFNEAMFAEALRVRDGLIATGANVAEAILDAAEMVAARHGVRSKTAQAQAQAQTQSQPKNNVKQPDVKAKMAMAEKQPPKVGGETHDAKPALDVMSMSVEEFDKLTVEEIARLRGDYL